MPADINVLVAGSSPITFPTNYLSYVSERSECNETHGILTSQPLDFSNTLSINQESSCLCRSQSNFTFYESCGRSSPTLHHIPSSPITVAKNLSDLHLNETDITMPVAVPRRPCLVVRCDVLDLPSPTKHKKRVAFADDHGFPLTLVRTMTEPSNMPPRWSFQFVTQVTKGASAEVVAEPWELTFSQPASDYLDFQRRLDTNKVSLENVIVKESEQVVTGTVKVRNLAFHKEVFMRATHDDWETQEDVHCTYVPNSPPAHGVTVLYDTFSFRLTLPPRSRNLQFCVCFRCSGLEFWDNNFGKNYSLTKKKSPEKSKILNGEKRHELEKNQTKINLSRRFSDDVIPNTQLDSWSEFASWSHLTNRTPYW